MHMLVGTHALLTDSTEFRNLGMAVIDEQHRWGRPACSPSCRLTEPD